MTKLWTPQQPLSIGDERLLDINMLRKAGACEPVLDHLRTTFRGDSVMISERWANKLSRRQVEVVEWRLSWINRRLLPETWDDILWSVVHKIEHSHKDTLNPLGTEWLRRRIRVWAALYVEAGKP